MKTSTVDVLIVFSVLALIAGAAVFLYGNKKEACFVLIHSDDGEEIYSLDESRIWQRQDKEGVVTIEIGDGKAAFTQSYCRGGDCVRSGSISENGGFSACLPARVWIKIENAAVESDALVY